MHIANWLYTVPLKLRSILSRRHVEQELDEELRYHIEQLTQAAVAKGLAPDAARYEALRAMNGMEQKKEDCRDARGVNWLENLGRDLRYSGRMLRKNPAFTVVAVLSLALGIGANAAIFTLIDTLLLRPLPVPQPGQLRSVFLSTTRRPLFYLSYPMFQALQAQNQIFSGFFCWTTQKFQMRSGPDMVHIDGVLASGDYFSTLGTAPIRGRTFTRDDDHDSGGKDGPVAVISEQFWAREFQRAPSAIGRGLVLDGIRFTVIGVMPADFFGVEVGTRPNVWVPLSFDRKIEGPGCIDGRNCWWLTFMGRLQAGISERKAEERLKIISPRILRDAGPLGRRNPQRAIEQFYLSPGRRGWTFLRVQFSNPLAILMTLVGLVLAIACANIASLLAARASARQREIAVRLSMGASRGRIIQQLLTESLLLSVLGAAAGSAFAVWLTRLLLAFLDSKSHFGRTADLQLDVHPDWRVVVFTVVVALASGLLFGLMPALRATRAGTAMSLKEVAHQLRGGDARLAIGRWILPAQAALSVLLVAAAGLFAGSLFHLLTLNLGFDPKDLTLIGVDTDRLHVSDAASIGIYDQLLERVNAIPGVRAASVLWFPPLSEGGWDDYVAIQGRSDLPEQDRDTDINAVGTKFFDVMRIRLLAGRRFNERDTAASEKVGILNELGARRFFPKQSAIGAHIVLERIPIRIVGVAGNIKYFGLREVDAPELYIPYSQKTGGIPSLTFVIKEASAGHRIYPAFRAALREIAPDVPVDSTKTMQEQLDASLGSERLMASLSIFFGAFALLLTSIGLYGTLAYGVTRRTGEIGIRMALGARSREVIWLVLRGTLALIALGTGTGVVAVLAGSRLVRSLLYGIEPNDPGNLAAAVVALLVVAMAAAYVPARRASRLDPTVALRQE